jgi:hypothetical protein
MAIDTSRETTLEARLEARAAAPPLTLPRTLRGRWALPLVLGAVLALLTAIPYVYAYLVQPPGQVFMGFIFLGDDANTYLAKMREGWEGAFAWTNRYTTESSPPAYLFLFWIALGRLAAVLHLSLLATFHLARVAGAFALMLAGWAFIELFLEDRRARRFAIFFLAFGLGLGYVVQALGHPVVLGQRSDTLDWRMPELSAFYSILALPHFTWSAVFQAAGVVLTLKAAERGSLRLGLLAGLAWLGQASIHPQMPILMGAAAAVALLVRRPSARGLAAAALAFTIAAPYVAYSYLAYTGNPEVLRWTYHSKNGVAPDLFSMVFALAPQLLLALPGAWLALRRRSRNDLFLLAWIAGLLAILVLPNPAGDLRRRFFDGLYLLLVVLAAQGLYGVLLPRLRSVRAQALVPFAWVTFSTVGSWFLILAPLANAADPIYALSTPRYDTLVWLDSQPPGIVLSSPAMGLYVPAYTPDTVYVGHYDETFDYQAKAQAALDAFSGRTDLRAFAARNHARYVLWTRGFGSDTPPAGLGEPAFSEDGVAVFVLRT